MSEHDPKPEAAQVPAPKPQKRAPTQREAAAIDKAVAYCQSRTQPFAYKMAKVEGGDITTEVPHSDTDGFVAQLTRPH